jgi:hypothetical protein
VTTVRTQTMRTPAETLRQGTASKATHTPADQYGGADQRWQRTTLGLGPLQSAIMEVLWAAETPLMVKEIRERVNYPPVSHSHGRGDDQHLVRQWPGTSRTYRPAWGPRPGRLEIPRDAPGQ